MKDNKSGWRIGRSRDPILQKGGPGSKCQLLLSLSTFHYITLVTFLNPFLLREEKKIGRVRREGERAKGNKEKLSGERVRNKKPTMRRKERGKRRENGVISWRWGAVGRGRRQWNSEKILVLFNCSVDFKMFSFGMSNVMVLSGHRSEGRTSDTIYRTNAKWKCRPPCSKNY